MRIAMLLHKSVEHDSRVRREARALLRAGHDVVILHAPRGTQAGGAEQDGFELQSVSPPEWIHRVSASLYRALLFLAFVRRARRLKPDVVHAHDVAMLAPGWAAARMAGARLVYDSHEYAPGVPYRERLWAWAVSAVERLLIRRCDGIVTVSDGISCRLQRRYALAKSPVVVRNVPDPEEVDHAFEAPDLREELGLPADTPLVIHLGAVAQHRGGQTLVRAIAGVPRAHLLFLGADDRAFATRLRSEAAEAGAGQRVHFRSSVPVGQIRGHTRQASAGVTLLEDTCDNHRLALPNKLFEYLDAEVPVVASRLPEMSRALAGRPATALVDPRDPGDVAAGIERSLQVSGEIPPSPFTWAEEAARLAEIYDGFDPAAQAGRRAPRALVLVRNGVEHDARVLREARLLGSLGYETTIAGVRVKGAPRPIPAGIGSVVLLDPAGRLRAAIDRLRARSRRPERIDPDTPAPHGARLGSVRRGGRWRRLATTAAYYRQGLALVTRLRPDVTHANDYNTAWIGLGAKLLTGSRLIYDSHELWPDRNLRPEWRPWLLLSEALFVRAADAVVTTSPGYADVMAARYRIRRPTVVRNLPAWRAAPGEARAGGAGPLAVYFGAVTRHRGLPAAIRALTLLPDLRLRIVGPEAWGYRGVLAELATALGVSNRVELLDPVAPEDAPAVMSDADVGLALIEPSCLSYRLTLPNKLYEYVAAGLPVLASDIPVLSGEVLRHGVGEVADPHQPASVAAALRAVLGPDENARFRAAAVRLAAETSWDAEREKLAAVYGPPR